MGLERYVVDAVVLEGRSPSEIARLHGISRSWLYRLIGRYREGGYAALAPRSRRPHSCSHRTPPELEAAIVALRAELADAGHDAGPATIAHHLGRRFDTVPSPATVWRILRRPGRPAYRQRCGVHRRSAAREDPPRDRARAARCRRQALDAQPPPDVRQGGALPPDPQALPRSAGAGRLARDPSAPARRLPALLQRGAAPPGPSRPDPAGCVQRPAQGPTDDRPGAHLLPGPPGPGEQGWQRHRPLPEPAPTYRPGSIPCRPASPAPHRRRLRPGRWRGRLAPPRARPRCRPRLPAAPTLVHDVVRQASTMSRERTLARRTGFEPAGGRRDLDGGVADAGLLRRSMTRRAEALRPQPVV